MTKDGPETVICHYRVREGGEAAFEQLLAGHWSALRRARLVTERAPQHFRALPSAKAGDVPDTTTLYVEIFEWCRGDAPERAHELPEVMAVWEPMGALCEDMQFPHFERLRGDG